MSTSVNNPFPGATGYTNEDGVLRGVEVYLVLLDAGLVHDFEESLVDLQALGSRFVA